MNAVDGQGQAINYDIQIQGQTKGPPPSADLRYEDEDTISPSTLICAVRKGLLGIYYFHIPPNEPKKLALR